MCGICGKIDPHGVDPAELRRMLAVIAHRGPDDEGVYTDGVAGLGNRRLSIIDLAGGRQPISNENQTVWTVFNGEIYNYRQLRAELEGVGHRFHTQSDTEVLIHLYEQMGERCVERISGMFAFAIWDAAAQKLFVARDRLGQKPLYYCQEEGTFLFASEPKAILAIRRTPAEIDLEAMHDYLSLRFIPPPGTIFKQVRKLPPAHTLVYQHGQVSIRRYWDLNFNQKLEVSEGELLEMLAEQLKTTVEAHLVSDVPVGAFLSGGLDSSMIVAILAGQLKQNPQTFSIGVEESDFDELPYARMVAERYHTRHVEERVAANLVRSLPDIVWHLDEPSDPIAACMFQAARLAARHVKVVLGGDGGDELFAGFDRYTGGRYVRAYGMIPRFLRSGLIAPILERAPDSFTYKSLTQKLRWVHQLSMQPSAAERYAEATFFFRFNRQAKQALYGDGLWRQVGEADPARAISGPYNAGNAEDALDRMLYSDYVTRLPEHSLMLSDRMTMAHGLEARSPFLDHELVETLARVPAGIKVRGGKPKALFRKLAAGSLPREIVERDKQGFMFPIAYWFRTELFPLLRQTLVHGFFVREGLFSRAAVERLLEEHRQGRVDHHVRLWMLLNLEVWQQLYIEGVSRETLSGQLVAAA